jgi:hypothetical protein
LCKEYGGNKIFISINLIILFAVFVSLMRYQWNEHRGAFFASIITFFAAYIIEYVYRKYTKREMNKNISESKN